MINELADYKTYLKITDDRMDAELTPLVNGVEADIKGFLNRDLESTTYADELYDGNGKSVLILRQFPITAVDTIYEWDGDSWDLIEEGTDYERLVILPDSEGIYLQDFTFLEGTQNYKITYTAGYSNIPSGIKYACFELAYLRYRNAHWGQGWLGKGSVNDNSGQASQSFSLDFNAEQKIFDKIVRYKAYNA